jgi:UDP-N-acetylglucosamine 4,6-dehydratase
MCPADDSHLTLEFEDHFVIKPTIQFMGEIDYAVNNLGEKGGYVEQGFEFHSGKNKHFLSIDEIKEYDKWSML